jgi:SAM-dependent methyltransferase
MPGRLGRRDRVPSLKGKGVMDAEAYRRKIKRAGIAAYWLRKGLARFRDRIPAGSLVLDVGSGDSPYRDLWEGARYLAVDLSDPEAGLHGDILSLPVRSECADLVVCTEVLEHVFDTDKALTELRRVLKPGGALLLSTPLIMGRHERLDFHRFTAECLTRFLAAAGFEKIEVEARGGLFSSLALLLTHIPEQLRPRRGLPRGRPAGSKESIGLLGKLGFPIAILFLKSLRLFVFLDRLDARKDFAMGYVVFSVRKQ